MVQQLAWENRMIYEIIVIVTYLVTGLVAEQCYTSTGGVYSAGSIYRNLKYCPFGCCGPALNRYCCPIVGPIVGICVGAIAFIVILIVIIVCCRKYSERQIRRRAEMKRNLGLTLSSRYDPPHYDTESNHVSSRQDYQIKSQSHHPTSSHRMYDEHDDDIDHRPNRKRHREDRYPQEENRHGSSHGHHRGETGSSRRHRHDSRREYHSDDDRLNSRRDSHRERRRHRDDHDRERRHSRSRERYMDRSYDDDDFSDEERYRRSSRRSRYSDPPPYRERSQDFYKDDRSSHRRTRSRERSYYN